MPLSKQPIGQAIGTLSNPALILDAAGLPLTANEAAAMLLGRGDQVLLEALVPPALRAEAESAGFARTHVSLPGQSEALALEVTAWT